MLSATVNAPLRLALFAERWRSCSPRARWPAAPSGLEPQADAKPAHAEGEDEHAEAGAEHGAAAHEVRGLASAADGLRMVVDDPELRRGRAERLAFRIVDEHGATVRDFDVEHTKRMHVIVARRDLTGFQHLHPVAARRRRLGGPDRAARRRLAASSPTSRATASCRRWPPTCASTAAPTCASCRTPAPAAVSDGGYDVELAAADAHPGEEAELRFRVARTASR